MIRTLIVLEGGLMRGALAFVLAAQDDIDVIGERDGLLDIEHAIFTKRPDVLVVDGELLCVDELRRACVLGQCASCRVLVLAEPRRATHLATVMTQHTAHLGFVNRDACPERVIDGVRNLCRGGTVLDADIFVAALEAANPLTPRERDVLRTAADGLPVAEIADRFGVAPATVRNHLSRIVAKTGASNRVQAVRTAQESGWI